MKIIPILKELLKTAIMIYSKIDLTKETSEKLWKKIKIFRGIETTVIDWRLNNGPDCPPECDWDLTDIESIFEMTSELRNAYEEELMSRYSHMTEDRYAKYLYELLEVIL